MEEFEKTAYRPKPHISRAQSPPPDSAYRLQSPLSRSVSPAPRPRSILRLPAVLRLNCEGSSTDRGTAPKWDVPTTREELLERYNVRVYETQPSPPRTRFLSYRLDAAALLVGRLTKHLAKVVQKWRSRVGEVRSRKKRRGMGSLSLQLQSVLGTESTESDTLDGWRSQTPVSLLSRRAWQQQRASERVYSALFTLISRRLRLLWEISQPLLIKESAALQIVAILEGCLEKQVNTFFTHELFETSTEQYQVFGLMIKGVNLMVLALCRVVLRAAYQQLRTANRWEHIETGLSKIGKFLRKKVKEDFNRLRFFAEVLEVVRRKRKRRQALRRPLQKLFSLFSAKITDSYRSGIYSLREAVVRRVFSLSATRPAMRVLVKGISSNVVFRLKTAFRIWAMRKSVSLVSASSPLIELTDKLLVRLRLEFAWKSIRRRSIGQQKNLSKAAGALGLMLSGKVTSRLIFAWALLKSSDLRHRQFLFLYLRRIFTTFFNRRLSLAFRCILSPPKSLVRPSKFSRFAR